MQGGAFVNVLGSADSVVYVLRWCRIALDDCHRANLCLLRVYSQPRLRLLIGGHPQIRRDTQHCWQSLDCLHRLQSRYSSHLIPLSLDTNCSDTVHYVLNFINRPQSAQSSQFHPTERTVSLPASLRASPTAYGLPGAPERQTASLGTARFAYSVPAPVPLLPT